MKRYIMEYANDVKREIMENEYMERDIATNAITKINSALAYADKGLLTIRETMRIINNPFE